MTEVHEFRVKVRFQADEPYTIAIYHNDVDGECSECLEFATLEEALKAVEKLREMLQSAAIDPYLI
jgi:hypothetical protein